MAITIPVTGGVIQAVEGETYILSANTTGNIIFQGDAAFNVEINDDQTFSTADNARVIRFDAGTDPTVNIAAGVDSSTHQIDANSDSLTVNLGSGATMGGINADGVGSSAGFELNAGDNVSIIGAVTGPNIAGAPSNYTIGNNFSTTNNLDGSVRADTTMTIGDGLEVGGRLGTASAFEVNMTVGSGATIGSSIDMRGIGIKNGTFGDGLDVTGNIDYTGGTGAKTMNLGADTAVSANINFAQATSTIVNIGDNLAVGGSIVGSSGVDGDDWIIGSNWTVGGNIDLGSGNDKMGLGFQGGSSPFVNTVVSGGLGVDGLTVQAPPGDPAGFIQAATDANWTDNGDGTVSAPVSASNSFQAFDFDGTRYGFWEGPGNPICFTAGTQITVANGETVNVEDLRQGDMVMTADNGLQEIKWTGTNTLAGAALEDNMRPIRISAGALGGGLPEQDLLVSPQHRMLVRSTIAQKMFGEDEVLVAAKHLVLVDGIDVVTDAQEVTYVHFLCDQHEVVFANGAASESLFTGPQALKSVSAEAAAEIMALFPELADVDYKALSARTLVGGRKGRQIAVRHKNNRKPLVATQH